VFDVDFEDPFEQPGPAHARRRALRVSVLARGLGGTLCRSGNDFTAATSRSAPKRGAKSRSQTAASVIVPGLSLRRARSGPCCRCSRQSARRD
jgi:hypothetical protein